MKKQKNKKTLGTLDYFIIFALVAVIACLAIRFFSTDRSAFSEKVELDEYIVSFSIYDIKDSSAKNYMTPGSKFYIEETGLYLGELRENLTIKDAEKHYTLDNGEIIIGVNNSSGDLYRVDVDGSFIVKGQTDSDGRFLLGGNTYLGVNKEIEICSKYLAVTATITDIKKS